MPDAAHGRQPRVARIRDQAMSICVRGLLGRPEHAGPQTDMNASTRDTS
jgi:hypothetical protein